jgi:hypothetical protein
MTIFMALGALRGMTTLLKIPVFIRAGEGQLMDYCWRILQTCILVAESATTIQ